MIAEDVKVCIPEFKNGLALIILSSDLLAMLTATAISTFKDLSFFNSSFICFQYGDLPFLDRFFKSVSSDPLSSKALNTSSRAVSFRTIFN